MFKSLTAHYFYREIQRFYDDSSKRENIGAMPALCEKNLKIGGTRMPADVFGAVSTVIDTGKKLLALPGIVKDADAKLLIAELQVQLAEVKSAFADLKEENTTLREQLRQRDEKPKMTVRGDVYFAADSSGPYCTACFDARGQEIRLTPQAPNFARVFGKYKCNVCDKDYSGE